MNKIRSTARVMFLFLFVMCNQPHDGDCVAQSKDNSQKEESAHGPYISLRLCSGIATYELGGLKTYLNALNERGNLISSAAERKYFPYFIEFDVKTIGNFWICAEVVTLKRDNTLFTSLPRNTWNSDVFTYDSDITSSSATIISIGVKYEDQSITLADMFFYCRADIGLVTGHLKYEKPSSYIQTIPIYLDYEGKSVGYYLGVGLGYRIFSFISIDAEIGYRYAKLDRLKDGDRILQYLIDPGAIVLLESKDERTGYEKMDLNFSGVNLKCGLRIIL